MQVACTLGGGGHNALTLKQIVESPAAYGQELPQPNHNLKQYKTILLGIVL